MSRAYDIVVLGASGYIGKLVAEHLATALRASPGSLRWALGGRHRDKLEAVRLGLGAIDPAAASLPIEIADTHDVAALDALVPKARVVCTTVGPYAKYGVALAAACARHGTHYCDIAGEIPFMRRSIDDNHAIAVKSRARIVHACGFDSVPFDLGVHVLFDHANTALGEPLAWAKGFVREIRGRFGGGGAATMLDLFEQLGRDPDVLRLIADPYALDPGRRVRRPRSPDQRGMRYDDDIGRWTAPFVMAAVDTRVVRRTNALLDGAYGDDFRYHEAVSFAGSARGLAAASLVTAGLGAFLAIAAFRPTRGLLANAALPKPGEGPAREARERGSFAIDFIGKTASSGRRISAVVSGSEDPACGATARMLGESALCLALDEKRLDRRWGVLTPASAMGMRLVDRLRAAGITFRVMS